MILTLDIYRINYMLQLCKMLNADSGPVKKINGLERKIPPKKLLLTPKQKTVLDCQIIVF